MKKLLTARIVAANQIIIGLWVKCFSHLMKRRFVLLEEKVQRIVLEIHKMI